MKIFREALIIFSLFLIGEFLSTSLSLPIPGNIVGMVLLLILLLTKVVKESQIETITNFLLSHLAFFFIPAGVGIISSVSVIKDVWLQIFIVSISTTIIIMVSTALIIQSIIKAKRRKQNDNK